MQACRASLRTLGEVASAPSKCARAYDSFIVQNASSVSQIESAIRSLTYIIPGRLADAEFASETLNSTVQLISLYHDSLLAKAILGLPTALQPTQTPHSRYASYWANKSSSYRRVALSLQVIQYTELLVEMAAKRRGEKTRWNVVVLLEFVKAICRLVLFRITGSRPLLSPPLPQREVDPGTLDANRQASTTKDFGRQSATGEPASGPWIMPRTKLPLPTLPSANNIPGYLLTKVLAADAIKSPHSLLHSIRGKGEVAEVIHILRPVIYALAMQYYARKNKKSWQPWILGIVLEYGARQLAKRDLQERRANGLGGLTTLEKDELTKRGWAMGWWLMRGPFYDNFTRAWIHGAAQKLKGKPLLDMIAGIIEDYEFLWDQYYFPTATM